MGAEQGSVDTVRMRPKVKGRSREQSGKHHRNQPDFTPRKEMPQMDCPHSQH